MSELLGICDRIYVMNDGAVVGEFAGKDASQEKIMRAIMHDKELPRATRDNDVATPGTGP